jgi:hypothetical protein
LFYTLVISLAFFGIANATLYWNKFKSTSSINSEGN